MAIAIRADATATIGSGHIMRCLTLADTLSARGETVHFITRSLTDPTRGKIISSGHALHELPPSPGLNDRPMSHASWLAATWQDDAAATLQCVKKVGASWLLVDHYGLDAPWEHAQRQAGTKLAVIDDLADRPHDCDLLLDQTLRNDAVSDYRDLVPPHAQKLFGLRYALLRPEFKPAVGIHQHTDGLRLCVAFSGADPHHLTLRTLDVLLQGVDGISTAHVIASSQNSDLEAIRSLCNQSGWAMDVDSTHVGRIMQSSHIGMGAGGGMLWERAACGLPSIAIIVAENQRDQVVNAAAAGLVIGLDAMQADSKTIRAALLDLGTQEAKRATMAATCLKALDGRGSERVAERLLPHDIVFRRAMPEDSRDIWSWRNDERVRRFSGNPDAIGFDQHETWFATVLKNENRHLLIASDNRGTLGVVRFDCADSSATISIYLTPDRLGQGRGASLLLAAEKWLKANHFASQTILATVHADNRPSVELFRSCGYVSANGLYQKPVRTPT